MPSNEQNDFAWYASRYSCLSSVRLKLARPLLYLCNKALPLYKSSDFILSADEIQTITPSPYSLPLSIRKKTTVAQEVRMSFAPTLVQSNDGRKFILNGVHHFFDYQGIKGQDIRLLNDLDNFQDIKTEHYPVNEENVYYFYADLDWFVKIFLILFS